MCMYLYMKPFTILITIFTSITNMSVINTSHDINIGVQSSNTYKCDHIINMHLKARWKIFTSLLTLKPLRVTDF